ncbi:MAG TPA: hypothetical protein VNZ58_03125 [Thermomicrobiales bacterium]|nr:hypothetical protein [Thermomicrobiales bacterium]
MNEDRFADFLDALVGGNPPGDASPVADIARRIQESATARLDDDRRSAIWRELMATHPQGEPPTGGPGPLAQPALTTPDAFNPWVRRRIPGRPQARNRMGIVHEAMQTGITAIAIVMVVIAAFVAFPIIRGDEAMPRVTPTAWAAAPTVPASGLGSSPSSDDSDIIPVATTIGDEAPSIPVNPNPVLIPTGVEHPIEPVENPYPTRTIQTPIPNAIYHHPQPDECSVEPLTVDEVLSVVEGGSSERIAATPETSGSRQLTEDEYRQITESHRGWIACHFTGTALQMLALESDDMIRADMLRINIPAYSPSLVAEQIASFDADSSSEVDTTVFIWNPPTDTYVPMIVDWNPDAAPVVSEDGRVTVTVVWMNRDGEAIIGEAGDSLMPFAAKLPAHWTYVWSESSGRWLLDGFQS